MQLRNSALLHRLWLTLAAALVLPGEAMAAWGNENWGTMVWGQGASPPVLPALGIVGLTLLAMGLVAAAAWTFRKQRPALGATLILVVLAIPLAVAAGTIGELETFVNGTTADADQVNANFDAVETAVNDNDSRITAAQSTANAAQSTATTANTNATAASSAAATAQGTADSATTVNTDQSADIAELQAWITAFQTYLATFCGNGMVEPGIDEACDDGNTTDDGNGCSASCQVNDVCGNGIVESLFETCDDAGTTGGDGCSALCQVEPDWGCTGEPSACTQERFLACADGVTVADHEMGLLWERKTGITGSFVNCTSAAACPDAHDVSNAYTWSSTGTAADGTAYTVFLADLNTAPGFAGHNDWRLPRISELQSILVGPGVTISVVEDPGSGANPTGQATNCTTLLCIDPGFDAVGGPTQYWEGFSVYWSATTSFASSSLAWVARFGIGEVTHFDSPKSIDLWVRAVRAGSCTN